MGIITYVVSCVIMTKGMLWGGGLGGGVGIITYAVYCVIMSGGGGVGIATYVVYCVIMTKGMSWGGGVDAKAKNSQGHSKVNELLIAFALRYNLRDSERKDMWRSLGKAVAEIS